MPIYKIRDDASGAIHQIEMDSPPTADDVDEIFAHPVAQAKQNYFQQLAGTVTQDIPNAMRGFANKTNQWGEDVAAPTMLGGQLRVRQGSLGDIVSGIPERTIRSLAVPMAAAGTALSSGVGLGLSAVNRIAGGIPGQFAQKYLGSGIGQSITDIGGSLSHTAPGQAAYNYVNPTEPGAKANANLAMDMSPLLGMKGAGAGAVGIGEKEMNTAVNMTLRKLGLTGKEVQKIGGLDKAKSLIKDYNLVGNNAAGTTAITEPAIEQANTLLMNTLRDEQSKGIDAPMINMQNVYDAAEAKALSKEKVNPIKLKNAFDDIQQNLAAKYGQDMKTGALPHIDLLEAQGLKRQYGVNADWNSYSNHPEAEINRGNAYNAIYEEMKTQHENLGGANVSKANKTMSDLIDINRAAVRKTITESRNNPIPLDAVMGLVGAAASGHYGAAIMGGLNLASKNPSLARTLYGTGQITKTIGNLLGGK